jgi:hypothetical protein
MRILPILMIVFTGCTFGLLACNESNRIGGECEQDSDCLSEFESCNVTESRCICTSEQACAEDEYCNQTGSCQKKTGCFSNIDCTDGICDVSTGECIDKDNCTTDFHCDLGQICEHNNCIIGCRDSSDCELMDKLICFFGACTAGRCEKNTDCDQFGEVCNLETYLCEPSTDNHCGECDPLCTDCAIGEGPCGNPTNVCQQETLNSGKCLLSCRKGHDEDCPAGFECMATPAHWAPVCEETGECLGGLDPIINYCGSSSKRCALNGQACNVNEDCYDYTETTECVGGVCMFGYHCQPSDGC